MTMKHETGEHGLNKYLVMSDEELLALPDDELEQAGGGSKEQFRKYLKVRDERERLCIAELNQPAPDFTVQKLGSDNSLSGESVKLSDLRGRPVALMFGSYTCPIFRGQRMMMNEVVDDLHGDIQFVHVYVSEAHAQDEGWIGAVNEKEGILYDQPKTDQERADLASICHAHNANATVLIDGIDNKIQTDYSAKPERLYVIDSDGVIRYKSRQGPFEDVVIHQWRAAIEEMKG